MNHSAFASFFEIFFNCCFFNSWFFSYFVFFLTWNHDAIRQELNCLLFEDDQTRMNVCARITHQCGFNYFDIKFDCLTDKDRRDTTNLLRYRIIDTVLRWCNHRKSDVWRVSGIRAILFLKEISHYPLWPFL